MLKQRGSFRGFSNARPHHLCPTVVGLRTQRPSHLATEGRSGASRSQTRALDSGHPAGQGQQLRLRWHVPGRGSGGPPRTARPTRLHAVLYDVRASAALSLQQPKWFETSLIVPPSRTSAWLVSELKNRSGFDVEIAEAQALTLLKGQQYFLVVLSADAGRYRRMERLDSVLAPDAEAPSTITRSWRRHWTSPFPCRQTRFIGPASPIWSGTTSIRNC